MFLGSAGSYQHIARKVDLTGTPQDAVGVGGVRTSISSCSNVFPIFVVDAAETNAPRLQRATFPATHKPTHAEVPSHSTASRLPRAPLQLHLFNFLFPYEVALYKSSESEPARPTKNIKTPAPYRRIHAKESGGKLEVGFCMGILTPFSLRARQFFQRKRLFCDAARARWASAAPSKTGCSLGGGTAWGAPNEYFLRVWPRAAAEKRRIRLSHAAHLHDTSPLGGEKASFFA